MKQQNPFQQIQLKLIKQNSDQTKEDLIGTHQLTLIDQDQTSYEISFNIYKSFVIIQKNKYFQDWKNIKDLLFISWIEDCKRFILHFWDFTAYLLESENRGKIVTEILKSLFDSQPNMANFSLYKLPLENQYNYFNQNKFSLSNKLKIPNQKYIQIISREKFLCILNSGKKEEKIYVKNPEKFPNVSIKDFDLIKTLGRGTMGKVVLAWYKQTQKLYAIKIIRKSNIIENNQLQNTKEEKIIFENAKSPFLVSTKCLFTSLTKIYFVMEFLPGGELFQYLKQQKIFDEKQTKFYAACIILALEKLHSLNYIYWDLKLENLLLDSQGYLKITDFGLAKKLFKNEVTNTLCGTPEYMAPEVFQNKGYNQSVDWWSLGILVFEMLFGLPPFYSKNIQEMFQWIKYQHLEFPNNIFVSPEAKDFIWKLLIKNNKHRLGSLIDSIELKQHRWFMGFDFNKLEKKQLQAPFIPEINKGKFLLNFDQEFTKENPWDTQDFDVRQSILLMYRKLFEEFDNNK